MGYGNEEIFLTEQDREALIEKYLGETVEMIIDRPIGYVHVTKGVTLHYTINYGYIPGVMGGDGEEQDVYLMGVDQPCVAGMIMRINLLQHRKGWNSIRLRLWKPFILWRSILTAKWMHWFAGPAV